MADSLRDLIYDAMGRLGDWEPGVIQPSQSEMTDYSHWRAVAADVARAITDAGWQKPSVPRVFYPGDTVPAGVWTVAEGKDGQTTSPSCSPGPRTVRFTPKLEVFVPTLSQFHAAVEQARTEREEARRG